MKKICIVGIVALILISGFNVTSIQDNTLEEVETCSINRIDNSDRYVDNAKCVCSFDEEPIVVAVIGFIDIQSGSILTWKEAERKLSTLKDIGVNTIFLWAPYDHPKEAIDTIPCWTEVNGEAVEIDLPIATFNVLNLHVKDYLKPDSRRGTDEDFLEFVDEAHRQGFKVIGQFIATCVSPESFFCQEHPEWLLKTEIDGEEYPAVSWPWKFFDWGYVVNKDDLEFINYTTEVVIPHWIEEWDLDGILLDSPGIPYCPERAKELCETPLSGLEYLTPISGTYTAEALIIAMSEKIDELETETGKDLTFTAEWLSAGVEYWPDEALQDFCEKGDFETLHAYSCQYANYELGKKFDFIWDYNFRILLKHVSLSDEFSMSDAYVEFLKEQMNKESNVTKMARFVNMLNSWEIFSDLLDSKWIGCYIVLTITAPGDITWIGIVQSDTKYAQEWYKKLVPIKREYTALQNNNIEDALISPEIKGIIAYNCWDKDESVSVVVNVNDKSVDSVIKTRFTGDEVTVYDVLSGEKFDGNPSNISIQMPAYSSRILVEEYPIDIEKPRKGYLYLFDQEITPTIFGKTIIIGGITVETNVLNESSIDRVEFYVGDELRYVDEETLYEWKWDEFAIGRYEVKVIAYDEEGNKAEDEIDVMIFNFG